ncbi:O-succinylbenzoate synthase [Mycobacterium sp. MBM]|nr:O-succinylbenzoate synthase [Mycobacterium sp. MBM]
MQTLIDLDTASVFAIPMCGGAAVHEGVLVEGPQGWGEFSPPPGCPDHLLVRWLTAATEPGTVGWPDARRGRVPVAVTVTATDPERARELVAGSGCRTASVEVGQPGDTLADDGARLAAVRDALGPDGRIRCDAKGRWSADAAVRAIEALDRAAGGLEFVLQPCRSIEDLAAVRRRVGVAIAIGSGLEQALRDPGLTEAADIVVLHGGSLGGARRALRIAESCGLPCTVTSGVATSIGGAVGVALAGALPDLPFAATLGSGSWLDGDLVADSRRLVPVDGFLPVAPMSPAPLPELLDRYTVSDPARVRWWRSRLESAIAQ